MSHPYSSSASYIYALNDNANTFDITRRNLGPYGHMKSLVPMQSLVSLTSAWPPTDTDTRSVVSVPVWRFARPLCTEELKSERNPRARSGLWGNRVGNTLGEVKKRLARIFSCMHAVRIQRTPTSKYPSGKTKITLYKLL
ncbi:hypothetical protein E4T56_gene2942 [Termitomyces sp. T112]|nr:hypothetical protein E4T56_gene2942 [Termitomyces sp. T112]